MQIWKQYCLYWFLGPFDETENVELQFHELPQLLVSCRQKITAGFCWKRNILHLITKNRDDNNVDEKYSSNKNNNLIHTSTEVMRPNEPNPAHIQNY
jgi:hypothetical protein